MPKNFQKITAFTAKDIKIASMWITPQRLLDLQSEPFMPRRISVAPVASQIRTPLGTGIIAVTAL
jgi:hypothetical protein